MKNKHTNSPGRCRAGKIAAWIRLGLPLLLTACVVRDENRGILPDVPPGAQAVSLSGEPLFSSPPGIAPIAKLRESEKAYRADPENPDLIIWYGRRTAYTGDYRGAILIFSRGIRNFRRDARFYRHRGHRYITIRQFDKAARDLARAADLIEGAGDVIEPDGIPNARKTPVSTLHTNIWYHLGLAYYLKNDLDKALDAYRAGLAAAPNDDMRAAFTHWLHMTLRRMGRPAEAQAALQSIDTEMDVIENQVYHRLCLFYKGLLTIEDLTEADDPGVMNDAAAYGVGAWFLGAGRRTEARAVFERILSGKTWASFGHIAAEADLAREFGEE